jgi:hypothetical protein
LDNQEVISLLPSGVSLDELLDCLAGFIHGWRGSNFRPLWRKCGSDFFQHYQEGTLVHEEMANGPNSRAKLFYLAVNP